MLGCGGLVLCWMVREGLTYKMTFEGIKEENHKATLGGMFQVGERASAKALKWEYTWQFEEWRGGLYGWSGVSNGKSQKELRSGRQQGIRSCRTF